MQEGVLCLYTGAARTSIPERGAIRRAHRPLHSHGRAPPPATRHAALLVYNGSRYAAVVGRHLTQCAKERCTGGAQTSKRLTRGLQGRGGCHSCLHKSAASESPGSYSPPVGKTVLARQELFGAQEAVCCCNGAVVTGNGRVYSGRGHLKPSHLEAPVVANSAPATVSARTGGQFLVQGTQVGLRVMLRNLSLGHQIAADPQAGPKRAGCWSKWRGAAASARH